MSSLTQKDIDYLFGVRKYILIAIILFSLSAVLGAVVTEKTTEGGNISQHVMSNIMIDEPTQFDAFVIIFQSNLYNCTTAILLGVLLGVVPIYIGIYNGILMGTVINFSSKMHNGVIKFILAVLPHGIIEIPIMFISIGIGLRMGSNIISFLRAHLRSDGKKLDRKIRLMQELKQSIGLYVRWILPGLLIAAVIEAYITPLIIENIFRHLIS